MSNPSMCLNYIPAQSSSTRRKKGHSDISKIHYVLSLPPFLPVKILNSWCLWEQQCILLLRASQAVLGSTPGGQGDRICQVSIPIVLSCLFWKKQNQRVAGINEKGGGIPVHSKVQIGKLMGSCNFAQVSPPLGTLCPSTYIRRRLNQSLEFMIFHQEFIV